MSRFTLLVATLGLFSATASAATNKYSPASACRAQYEHYTSMSYSQIFNNSTTAFAVDCALEGYYRPSNVGVQVYDNSTSSNVSCYQCYANGATITCGASVTSSAAGTGYTWLYPVASTSTTATTIGSNYIGCWLQAGSNTYGVAQYYYTQN